MNTFLIYNKVFENVEKKIILPSSGYNKKKVKLLIITLKSSHESV